jgi:hypothetical protein
MAVDDFMVPMPTNVAPHHIFVRTLTNAGSDTQCCVFEYFPRPDYAKKPSCQQKPLRLAHHVGLYCEMDEGACLMLHCPEDARIQESIVVDRAGTEQYLYRIQLCVPPRTTRRLYLVHAPELGPLYRTDFRAMTRNFWYAWTAQGRFPQTEQDAVVRSAITLKLLQYYPTGAIVAAPTTSLPEAWGGPRNFDYRYVWMRDATFTLYAFYVLGYMDELLRFFQFIEVLSREDCPRTGKPRVRLMYTIHGKPVPDEVVLAHLEGYANSRPVRIGNQAATQFQLDVYGALIDFYYFASRRGLEISEEGQHVLKSIIGAITEEWMIPDHGIWEVRGFQRDFAYSKIMSWVGANRALKMAESGTIAVDETTVSVLKDVEQTVKQWVWEKCYDSKRHVFVQHPDTDHTDATNFLYVLLQFLDRHDPITRDVVHNTWRMLVDEKHTHKPTDPQCSEDNMGYCRMVSDFRCGFVLRYRTEDGFRGEEGAFLLCSCWLASALAAIGDFDDARTVLREVIGTSPRTGLVAEEYDPSSGKLMGNHPQAFSHIGVIMAAFYIDKYASRQQATASTDVSSAEASLKPLEEDDTGIPLSYVPGMVCDNVACHMPEMMSPQVALVREGSEEKMDVRCLRSAADTLPSTSRVPVALATKEGDDVHAKFHEHVGHSHKRAD